MTSNANQIQAIAQRHLNIETLETRNSDSLDFHDVCVASLKDALEAAYKAGAASEKCNELKHVIYASGETKMLQICKDAIAGYNTQSCYRVDPDQAENIMATARQQETLREYIMDTQDGIEDGNIDDEDYIDYVMAEIMGDLIFP